MNLWYSKGLIQLILPEPAAARLVFLQIFYDLSISHDCEVYDFFPAAVTEGTFVGGVHICP
jgi:hypothetical protein